MKGFKTGGRVKGTPNRATKLKRQGIQFDAIRELFEPEQVAELSPLVVMLRVMRQRLLAGDEHGALAAAALAVPYTAARLSATDVTHRSVVESRSDAEIEAEIERIRELRFRTQERLPSPSPDARDGDD